MNPSFAMVRNSVILAAAAAILSVGCAAAPENSDTPQAPSAAASAPRIATGRVGDGTALRDPRVEAFPDRTLVVPIGPEDAEGGMALSIPPEWRPRAVPEVALVTDEPLPATIWRIRGTPRSNPDINAWLTPPLDWTAEPLDKAKAAPADNEVVLWFLAIDMPDRPVGRWLRIGQRKLPLEWVPVPDQPEVFAISRVPSPATDLAEALESEADPFRAWRLAMQSLRSPGPDDPTWTFEGVLEPIHIQMCDRAIAAMARIRAADPALADRVFAMLTAVIRTPDGARLPAWPADPAPALALFASVLREDRTPAEIRADAQAFLATAPPALVWVVDEGGPDGPSGAPLCTVAIADRSGARSIVSAAPLSMTAVNSVSIEPFRTALLPTDTNSPGDITAAALTVFAGAWTTDIRVLAGAVAAAPPGVTLGPLVPEWNHITLTRGIAPRINPAYITVAVLQRQVDAAGAPTGWELLIEAQRADDSEDDHLTVWLGSMGDPTAAIYISPTGEATVLAGELTGEKLPVNIRIEPGRWVAQLPLPSELTSVPRLRIGIERTDGRGVRSSWPRPMLPGQPEPGRLAVDLTSW